MRIVRHVAVLAAVGLLSLAALAARAQSPGVRHAYETSHSVPTNIRGITGFAAPPAGFDALHAADEQLAGYGLPPRPDLHAAPEAYATWARAMRTPSHRATAPLRDMHMSSTNGHRAGPAKLAAGLAATPSTISFYNWSGIANTVPGLTAWNGNRSFYSVVSEFNVPVARQALGVCDGGWDYEVNWNGIDGLDNGDVLQGGSYSAAYCNNGSTATDYCAWVEWYPSYPILCEFTVHPGDVMFVETWDTSSTNGYVYIHDLTLGISATYHLQPTQPPYLVGNSAEYIVERPCCDGTHDLTLANYIENFWADSYAYTFAANRAGGATAQFPGANAPSTYVISMVNDQNTQVISVPVTGGHYDITFSTENCARSGGCDP